MAANRKLPFGYAMRMGKVCIHEQEVGLVREIFSDYAKGASYQQLTGRLNAQPIPYNEPDKAWNKNMVARILCCGAYVGTDTYPAIITAEQWEAAHAAKPGTGKALGENSDVKTIRQLARCSQCGSSLKLGSNSRSWERWKCPVCGALTTKAVTPRIRDGLTALISQLLDEPELVQEPEDPEGPDSATEQEEALDAALNAPQFDETHAHQSAFALAAARFDAIGSEDYETLRIRKALTGAEKQDRLDTALLKETAAAVLIHPNGMVSLRLKNNQIIEGR